MHINIYNLISGAFCIFVGFLCLARGRHGSGGLFYWWAAALWLMAAGVIIRMWQLQAAAGFLMVASVVIDERLAARHYAIHRLDLQDEAAREIRTMRTCPDEEPVSYEILLKPTGDKREQVIETLRKIYVLSPKDAQDLAKGGVRPIKQFMSRQEAEYVKARLEECGAEAEVKQM